MDNYRRRQLVYFSTQSSNSIIDPTVQDVPNGVYIEDTDGILYRKSAWPSSGVTPNSVVVITDDCKVRLALTQAPNTMKIDPNGGVQDSTVTGFHDEASAKTDYNGALNTANILKIQSGTNYAAGYCANFTFPDGMTKGCLPAFGQMCTIAKYDEDVQSCLSVCGGTEMMYPQYYWTSTYDQTFNDNTGSLYWTELWNLETGVSMSSTDSYYVRPVAEYKPFAKDLSMVSGTRNTANCYMVHKAGTYRIPLVYGNAIKNGQDNQVAYKPGGTTTETYCANFINHNGDPITAPWITKSGTGVNGGMGITVDSAEIVWKRSNTGKINITNLAITGDYLSFEITSSRFREFDYLNAVLAVKSGNTIVWSWHIWATLVDYSVTIPVNVGDHVYKVAPCNLGWVNSDLTSYGENWFINKRHGNVESDGECPYFIYGRKDALPPLSGYYTTEYSSFYAIELAEKGWSYSESSATIPDTIKNPNVFFKSGIPSDYCNLWNSHATDNTIQTTTIKTIYDPCPAGFCVPSGRLWQYLVTLNYKNVIYSNDRRRPLIWYELDSDTSSSTYPSSGDLILPAAGTRLYNGTMDRPKVIGCYLSSSRIGIYNFQMGYSPTFDMSTPLYYTTIRPVAEE